MKEFVKFIYPYTLRQKRYFLLSIIFVCITVASQLIVPLFLKEFIDKIETLKEVTVVYTDFFILFLLAGVEFVGNLGSRIAGVVYSRKTMENIRKDIFHKLHEQELEFFSRETVGQLMARTIEEVYSLQDILTWGWRIMTMITLLATGTFLLMFMASPLLSLIFGVVFPIILYLLARISKKNAHIFYSSRLKFGNLADVMAENFTGIKTVKSFGRESEQIQLFKEKNDDYIYTTLQQIKIRAYLRPFFIFIFSLAFIGILAFGGVLIEQHIITVGTLIAFLYLILRLTQVTRFLGELGIYLMIADSAALLRNEVLKAPLVMVDVKDAVETTIRKGEIEFRNVSFTYPGNKYKSLKNISLSIKAGEKLALLGPTGSGKTTLINLIPRFYDPSFGDILIDGQPIKEMTRHSLRDAIQIVHQDNFLYTMDLYSNIAFGRPDTANTHQVINVSRISQIHSFIDSLEDKYATVVGERGVTLSGGQRQRTTIARGLLPKPKILIFDDSVSAVDPSTEARIQEGLAKIGGQTTVIIISQRPSSLRYVDRIVVLDEGQVVQDGTHEELLRVEGIYKRFMNSVKRQVQFIDWDSKNQDNQNEHGDHLPTGGL